MCAITFNVSVEKEYSIVTFELRGVISPEDLVDLIPPKVEGKKGVILSGRGPIWLYCFLTHYYHPTKFIAIYDPRLAGAVIVETHTVEHSIGSVLMNLEKERSNWHE